MKKSLIFPILFLLLVSCQQAIHEEHFKNMSMEDHFDKSGEILLKLYKETENGTLYWETWNTDEVSAVIHWGRLGHTGDNISINADTHQELKSKVN